MPISGPPLTKPIQPSQLLQTGLDGNPDGPALISAESRYTWRELDRAADRLAAAYLDLGLRPGDRIASLMPNRPALVVHYLACFKSGLVATPLNYRYMPPEIDHALGVSGARAIFAHAERQQDLAASKLSGQLPLGRISYAAPVGWGPSFEEFVARDVSPAPLPPPRPDAPAFILFTSGSTGLPKGVTHTFETFGWQMASLIEALEYSPRDVVLPGSSFSHLGGIAFGLGALAAGAPVVMPRTFDGDELLPLFRSTRPTVLWMLPAALIALVRDHGARREDFRSIRYCISGGDKVSAQLEREFTDLAGFPIDEGYGMTEIGCATRNPPSGVNKLGSVGLLSPGYEMSIRDESGAEQPIGVEGRLWIKSPANMIGYWTNPTATAETIKDGWLDTGDVMAVDGEGYLWFRGRRKQIIVHDGSNICPQEIEEALQAHPAVKEAGVVGVHDLIHGENVRAYVTLMEGVDRPTGQELIQFARERVGYKAPEVVVVLDEMPLNATGKVDRVTLKKMAEAASAGVESR